MDPNANLKEQLAIAKRIINGRTDETEAERLAELIEALDEWIRRGGFLPDRWVGK